MPEKTRASLLEVAYRYINRQIAIGRQADLRRPVAVVDVNEAICLMADNDNKTQ